MTAHHPKRIYLAGPEVFFPADAHKTILAHKLSLLRDAGLEGVDPLDTTINFPPDESLKERGFRIYRANRDLMDNCHGVIANLTPFRGISADPGTVFEVGYMIGHGKPACGFTVDSRTYYRRAGATEFDDDGLTIENFDLEDNLMISCSIVESGGVVATGDTEAPEHAFFCAKAFMRCVQTLAEHLS
ncbi:nucleoside 2-deoxyribosyltransferase [Marinobacter salinisoli]|uniref:Nucleoside 2-deoxyribosyltransferase n=1 Tax=Marinobacter salinisoli TaxID=2769486 RepID=A0ABX7MNK4_9GAMM|nr:nucleoside 2-deoxyribosyltransferase [Marinobacter salinisoli]QSP93855.1 nucleoside 2-deoxyribosyltransferase [Marinobacter salinisoli]